jgi:hypothetical protein
MLDDAFHCYTHRIAESFMRFSIIVLTVGVAAFSLSATAATLDDELLSDSGLNSDSQPLLQFTQTNLDRWMEEESGLVSGVQADGVAPFEGDGMLQIRHSSLVASQVRQRIDVSSISTEIAGGNIRADVRGLVNASIAGTSGGVLIVAYSPGGAVSSTGAFVLDGDVATWEQSAATLLLPVDTTHVEFQYAFTNGLLPIGEAAYGDSASMVLREVPASGEFELYSRLHCGLVNPGSGTCDSGGSGQGLVNLTYDNSSSLLSWDFTWGGLSSAATSIHFRGPASAAGDGGLQIDVGAIGGVVSPTSGSTTLTTVQAVDLLSDRWYVDIRSAAFPGGEMRGTLINGGTGSPCDRCLSDPSFYCYLIYCSNAYHGNADPDQEAIVSSNLDIQPGASLSLSPTGTLTMSLIKEISAATVDITSLNIEVSVPSGTPSGITAFSVTGGSGAFAPYVFKGENIATADFSITNGSGSFDWATGEGNFTLSGSSSLFGFSDVIATASGSLDVDFDSDTVTISLASVASELEVSPVPGLGSWWVLLAVSALVGVGAAGAKYSRKSSPGQA